VTVVEIALGEGIPGADAEALRTGTTDLSWLMHEPVSRARITLRREHSGRARRSYIADASLEVEGRTIAAHAAGEIPLAAVDAVCQRLRRQLRRVLHKARDPQHARTPSEPLPVDPAHRPEARLKRPHERQIVHRRTYLNTPLGTVDAVRDLLDIDAQFMLFVHARTSEDVVVYLRDDRKIGLLFPPGSKLSDEDDIVVPKESRYPGPIELRAARTEMDFLDHRFLYFIDAADTRGKCLYLRHDGDYGLVEPP
jgi:ribosome-associated translation inhibitor RaiA